MLCRFRIWKMILYKYLSSERIDVLKNGSIRFTQPEFFNDPFEALPKVERLFSDDLLDGLYAIMSDDKFLNSLSDNSESKQFVKQFRETFIRDNFASNKNLFYQRLKPNEDLTNGMSRFFNSIYGILSLSEVDDSILMWSHYASNHKGFVIGFNHSDEVSLLHDNAKKPLKINYTKQRPHITIFDTKYLSNQKYLYRWYKTFLLTKSIEWCYEQEWRLIQSLSNYDKKESENIYLYKYNKEAVAEIILGCKISQQDENEILEIVKDWGVKVYKMYISEDFYSLEKKEIS